MSLVEKLILGCNTTVIGMGIVFLVLIILSIIISVQSKLIMSFFNRSASKEQPVEPLADEVQVINKAGSSVSGKTLLSEVDDETAALIMIIVSHHVNIPLDELKFKSIKAI